MKRSLNYIGMLLMATMLLAACSTTEEPTETLEVEEAGLPTFADFYQKLTQRTDGKVNIYSYAGLGSQDVARSNSIKGYFNTEDGKVDRAEAPRITVDGISLDGAEQGRMTTNRNQSIAIQSLFGKTVTFNISESMTNGRELITEEELYVPELLSIENQLETLSVGDVINWNGDAANVNGLALKFEYRSLSQTSADIAAAYPDDIIAGFIVPDNGSLTITSEMLSQVPSGADVRLTVARGNIDFISAENDDELYTVGAITAVETRTTIMH